MKKMLSVLLAAVMLLALIPAGAIPVFAATSGTATITITFDDKAKMTEWDDTHAVWAENGITVTNNQGNSVSPVKDYAKPARFYKNSELIVAYKDKGIVKIVFNCSTEQYAANLAATIDGVEADGTTVTITFETPVYSYTIAALSGGQVRLDSIDITSTDVIGVTGDCLWRAEDSHLIISGKGSMGDYTFPDASFTSITIEEGVTAIGRQTFRGCTSLKTVTIPSSVTTIGIYAFYGCESLTVVHYHGMKQDKTAIAIQGGNGNLTDATWHYYDDGCDATCNECDVIREPIHEYTDACDRDCNLCGAARVAPHVYKGVCDGDCNLCGFRRAAAEHTYSGVCDAGCNVCGLLREAEPHTYDAVCDPICNACGAARVTEHIYDNTCDTDCNVCGDVRVTEHTYDNTCDTDCNVCGDVRVTEHTYDNACDTDCNVCGVIRGVPDHIYSDACDVDCNVCRAKREPSHAYAHGCDDTCDGCGAYRDVPGHVYDHLYDDTCNICGDLREAAELVVGDADVDGAFTVTDVVLLQQYLNGWDVEVYAPACDTDGDGKVNNWDLVQIIRKLNGWDI